MSVKKRKELNVYIIDPHVLMRQMFVVMLRNLEGISVIDSTYETSEDHVISVIKKHAPDVIFLGVDRQDSKEMQLFHLLRREYSYIPVILLTPLSKEGAFIAISALKNGAVDFITRPCKKSGLVLANSHFHKRVLPIIKMVPRLNLNLPAAEKPAATLELESNEVTANRLKQLPISADLVVIGGCTGGVRPLFKVISGLPEQLPVPVVVVQHMPKIYTHVLAEELDRISPLNVREAQNNSLLLPGQIYVAPGGYHTVVKNNESRNKLFIHRGPREHKNRPSIDSFIRSAIQVYRDRVLGVFLSGAGRDGILGAKYLKESGSQVILESEESALLWQLPGKIHDLNFSLGKFPADRLGIEITKQIFSPKRKKSKGLING